MPAPPVPPPRAHPSLLWDVFCHVVDNLGDIGVCWRLCADLASRGQRVRLWIDQPEPLRWMAPGALDGQYPGVQVLEWTPSLPIALCGSLPAADVWVETFGCHPPEAMVRTLARHVAAEGRPPVWINLEYLSAEPYVERSHRLPSPVMAGPLKGMNKWFFYPGFTAATGGLLRELDLLTRQAAFNRDDWLHQLSLPQRDAMRVAVFCYEPPPLADFVAQVASDAQPVDWLVTPGRAAMIMRKTCESPALSQKVSFIALPPLTQRAFDELLWASDLNLVRGEDSLVRALWAGQAFVWHIYPQQDNAHHAKLLAFLDWLEAPDSLRQFHLAWNGLVQEAGHRPLVWPGWQALGEWRDCTRAARQRLWAQADLSAQLLDFVVEKR